MAVKVSEAARYPADNFELNPPGLFDLNGEGKKYFIFWDAQCVKAPARAPESLSILNLKSS